MSLNRNPWINMLLQWHGHGKGGVRVPFQDFGGNPLGRPIETALLQKIRLLATELYAGNLNTPRWIFLVGGPGNGKSEAVEVFIRELDLQFELGGSLIQEVAKQFAPNPIVQRRVEVGGTGITDTHGMFERSIKKVIIIQDASAVDGPTDSAEEMLSRDLANLMTIPASEEPIFICCANRGLIARTVAFLQNQPGDLGDFADTIVPLLTEVLEATGLGIDSMSTNPKQCWPLREEPTFACWPLDLDSLIEDHQDNISPFEQIILEAINSSTWDDQSHCGSCEASEYCPFTSNVHMLRDAASRKSLLTLLRHGELATGQRWNFRDAYSLVAELLIGQTDDFVDLPDKSDPCAWVHSRVLQIQNEDLPDRKIKVAWELVLRLYQQALFPNWNGTGSMLILDKTQERQKKVTAALRDSLNNINRKPGKQVRNILDGKLAEILDPAHETPLQEESILKRIEDEYGQSVAQGNESFRNNFSPLERIIVDMLEAAETEWDDLVKDVLRVHENTQTIRWVAAAFVKRSLGVSCNEYAAKDILTNFRSAIRDQDQLWELASDLRKMIAPSRSVEGSLVQVYGQPRPSLDRDVYIRGNFRGLTPVLAPVSSTSRPGHDIPRFVFGNSTAIPLTYELFHAISLHKRGCDISCLQPHTRAAIDKMRNEIVEMHARNGEEILNGSVEIRIGRSYRLYPDSRGLRKIGEE